MPSRLSLLSRHFIVAMFSGLLAWPAFAETGKASEKLSLSVQERWKEMLAWKVTRFEVKDMPVLEAIQKLQQTVDEEHRRSFTISARDPQVYQEQRVSIKMAHARLKDVLQALVKQSDVVLKLTSLGLMVSPREENREE